MNSTWLLIDSDYLCHRAKWSMGDLKWHGKPTAVIYGFLQSVLQLQDRFNTNNIAFCFDSKISKRKIIYPLYKANRRRPKPPTPQEAKLEVDFHKQIQLLRKTYLPEIGFRNVFRQTGYESDDLLAMLSKQMEEDAIIVTADEDLFQCIRSHVSVYNPFKHTSTTLQRFFQTYKIIPNDWITVKALAGCPTDNIKGLQGIGEKTAIKWILGQLKKDSKAYQTLTSPIASVTMARNMQLVRLPFDGTKKMKLRKDRITKAGWESVCKKLGFKSIVSKTPGGRRDGNNR